MNSKVKKIIIAITSVPLILFLLILLAGIYRFNIVGDDVYFPTLGGEVFRANDYDEQVLKIFISRFYGKNFQANDKYDEPITYVWQSIYFDINAFLWKDEHGICSVCTPKNGFSKDGQIDLAVNRVKWLDVFLQITHFDGKQLQTDEVTQVFRQHYVTNPPLFGIHVKKLPENIFQVITAFSEDFDVQDFLDPEGYLMTHYKIKLLRDKKKITD